MISRQPPNVAVSKLSDTAIIPKRGSTYAAGLDLYTPTSGVVQPGKRLLVNLDIAIELPSGTFGHILPRSGLALKNGIHIGAGVIDEDYRGNVGVLLFNLGEEPYVFNAGDRIAQLVVKPYVLTSVSEKELSESQRGSGGFGSSGK
jgi:dUTP pyrophosphatase